MHDFVVAEGQDEVLVEGIDQAEGDLVLVVAAVDRVLFACTPSVSCIQPMFHLRSKPNPPM